MNSTGVGGFSRTMFPMSIYEASDVPATLNRTFQALPNTVDAACRPLRRGHPRAVESLWFQRVTRLFKALRMRSDLPAGSTPIVRPFCRRPFVDTNSLIVSRLPATTVPAQSLQGEPRLPRREPRRSSEARFSYVPDGTRGFPLPVLHGPSAGRNWRAGFFDRRFAGIRTMPSAKHPACEPKRTRGRAQVRVQVRVAPVPSVRPAQSACARLHRGTRQARACASMSRLRTRAAGWLPESRSRVRPRGVTVLGKEMGERNGGIKIRSPAVPVAAQFIKDVRQGSNRFGQ